MQYLNPPPKVPLPFATAATGPDITNPFPIPSQIGVQNGRASWTDGFPPNCFIPIAAGGSWPWGADANKVFQFITAGLQWIQAGGAVNYDATFQTQIGGYPAGCIVRSNTLGLRYWASSVDNNMTDPDTGGAGWADFYSLIFYTYFPTAFAASFPAAFNSLFYADFPPAFDARFSAEFVPAFYSNFNTQFPISLNAYMPGSAPNWQRFQDGTILQCGQGTVLGGTDYVIITFPTTFPTNCRAVLANEAAAQNWNPGSGWSNLSVYGCAYQNSYQAYVYAGTWNPLIPGFATPATGREFNWWAVGN